MLNEKLRGLLTRYCDSLAERRDSLQTCVSALEAAAAAGDDLRQDPAYPLFRRDAHQLAGSGGSMGFPELGRTALYLDVALVALTESPDRPGPAEAAQLRLLTGAVLKRMAGLQPDHSSLLQPADEQAEAILMAGDVAPGFAPPGVRARQSLRLGTEVILISQDEVVINHLQKDLAPYGLILTVRPVPAALASAQSGMTTLVILDRDACPATDPEEGGVLPADVTAGLAPDIPVAVMDHDDSLQRRIDARQAGAVAFVGKPVNAAVIVDLLDRLHHVPDTRPPSVVVLGDDGMEKALCLHALQAAGMTCISPDDPDTLLQCLTDARPDLLILLRRCAGLPAGDILGALRQHPAYVSLPALILGGRDADLHADSVAGADVAVALPFDPDVLVLSVWHRVQRSREVQALITRDSLCNLLTHGAFINQLERELSLARRGRSDLSVALLDIDGLREINELWGHQTGDAVLQGFSRLLRQRMRKTDIIGRLGGETFAIILPGASKAQARQVITDIAGAFRSLDQPCRDGVFQATVSAGIAGFTDGAGTVRDCLRAADSALFAAKNRGRDQVCLASPSHVEA